MRSGHLLFCGHHYNKLSQALRDAGWALTKDNRNEGSVQDVYETV